MSFFIALKEIDGTRRWANEIDLSTKTKNPIVLCIARRRCERSDIRYGVWSTREVAMVAISWVACTRMGQHKPLSYKCHEDQRIIPPAPRPKHSDQRMLTVEQIASLPTNLIDSWVT